MKVTIEKVITYSIHVMIILLTKIALAFSMFFVQKKKKRKRQINVDQEKLSHKRKNLRNIGKR